MYTFTLPSGLEAEIREMTGAEEEILTNPRLIRSGEAINRVLENCVLRLGDNDKPSAGDMLDLLSGDRLFLLVKLRQVSLGDEVKLELVCPNTTCREVDVVSINIEELVVTPYTAEREFSLVLPGSKARVGVCSRSARPVSLPTGRQAGGRHATPARPSLLGLLTGLRGRGTRRCCTGAPAGCSCARPTGISGRRRTSSHREARGTSRNQAPSDR